MPAALLTVLAPILHPIAARAGDVLVWHPTITIVVARKQGGAWREVRRLRHDNSGSLAGLLADDIIAPFSAHDAALLRVLLAPPPAGQSAQA